MPICWATMATGCCGRTHTFVMMRTLVVTAAAAASEATISGLLKVTRSPADTLLNGPASMPRDQSTVVLGA